MNSHKIDYGMIVDDMQIVEIELDPGETVIAKTGKIICVDLKKCQINILCQKDPLLCTAPGTKVPIASQKELGAEFFGGQRFFLDKLSGDGRAFIHAGGTFIYKQLKEENLRVDSRSIDALEENIQYNIQIFGVLKSTVFGGQVLFFATISGHGTVWLHSLPFSRLADRVFQNAPTPTGNGKSQGEGSVLGGFDRMIGVN